MIEASLRRRILAAPKQPDPYIRRMAAGMDHHRYLGRAVHGCYLRQIDLLVEAWAAKGKKPQEVRVLDWGCGTAHITYMLRQVGFDVVSCDVVPDANWPRIPDARDIANDQGFEIVPLEHPYKLPFQAASFDMVVSFGVLEHVPNEAESLKEIRRVLKADGVFFFTFLPYFLSWGQRLQHLRGNYFHDRLYSARHTRSILDAAGLELQSVWHGQLLPKNRAPFSNAVERLDRFLTEWTPLKYLATNLEGFATVRAV
jgi:SAM-dependent methyltransferase